MTDFDVLEKLLPPEDIAIIRRAVLAVRPGDVAMVPGFWAPIGLGFAGLAASGRLVAWTLFPAVDEASACDVARAQFELAAGKAMQVTELAAAARFPGFTGTAH